MQHPLYHNRKALRQLVIMHIWIFSYFTKFDFHSSHYTSNTFIMKIVLLLMFSVLMILNNSIAQEDSSKENYHDLPYRQIPDYPGSFTAENVAARMIDGLGYRYYWATEGLRGEDLDFHPGNEGRSTGETIDHIYGLSLTILNASLNMPNVFPREEEDMNFEETRRKTLENLDQASRILKDGDEKMIDELKVIFQNSGGSSEFPYWNMLNGPIADAIYHTGQVVAFRRSSGNPINPNVRVFLGKTTE